MRAVLIALFLYFVVVQAAEAAVPANLPPAADAAAVKFLNGLKKGEVETAFKEALEPIAPQVGVQNMENTSAQISALVRTFGDVIDWSKYQTDWITPTLIRQTYFVRSTFVPFFVTVLFYDNGKGWHIVDLQFNSYDNGRVHGFYDATPASP